MQYSQIKTIANRIPPRKDDYKYTEPYTLDGYDFIGIRIQAGTHGMKLGQTVTHVSHVWDDGEQLPDTLPGICAIDLRHARKYGPHDYGGYDGDTAIILGSNHATRGDDPGEIIMRDAVVLDIWWTNT